MDEADLKTVRLDRRGAVLVLTLDRPERLNTWTGRMHTEYRWALARAEADRTVRVVVVTGAGRGFCAGADARALDGHVEAGGYVPGTPPDLERPGHGVRPEFDHPFAFHFGLRFPVIAAINGPAAGVGLVLACFCDVRFASAGAKLTTSSGRLGLPAEFGLSWVLPRLVGLGRAADLLLSSRVVMAEEAAEIGLVNRVLPPAELLDFTFDYAGRLATEVSPAATREAKRQLYADLHGDVGTAVARSEVLLDRMMTEPDFVEGVAALEGEASACVPRLKMRLGRAHFIATPCPGPAAKEPAAAYSWDTLSGRASVSGWSGARLAAMSAAVPPLPSSVSAAAAVPAEEPDRPSDLAIGAFSDEPPWIVEPDKMSWRRDIRAERVRVRRELPDLVRPRRLPPGLRVITVVRHLGAAVGLWALRERRAGKGTPISRAGLARRLRIAAEALGSTYIKLGQIISSGEGLFPEELVREFRKCRDQVPPERFAVIREVIEADLGRPLSSVFSSFDRAPLAAASIAQVHAATLRTGERVVVKVQRPQVARLVREDLRVMAWLAPHLVGRIPVAALANPPALVDLFAETITEELDFRLEAENQLDIARSFADLGQRGYVIPRPHPELVTRRVLVMERLDGFAFDDVIGMKGAGVDTEQVVRTGMIGFLEGCMLHGIFHGDLHGGNLFVRPDGRTALLDFGITGRLSESRRLAFLRLIMGASMNDVMSQMEALRDLGALPADADLRVIIDDLGLEGPAVDPTTLTPEELTGEIQRTVKALLGYGARMPKELMLFVKNLVFLDGAIATLAPDLDLFAEIAEISLYFARRHGDRIASDVGMNPNDWQMDLTGMKASFGVDPDEVTSLTYRELQERRKLIGDRLAKKRK